MSAPRRPLARRPHQRGLATLVVVMVLFFLVSLTAAYTSRNMVFEQRTSANQYRGTQAFEAANGGIEWAIAMLNGGVVNDNCGSSGSPTLNFQQRYMAIDANGLITHPARNGNWPTCVYDGAGFGNCSCPNNTSITLTAPTGPGSFPAFRVWLAPGGPSWTPSTTVAQLLTTPGLVTLQAVGCTRLATGSDRCLDFVPAGDLGDGVALQRVILALRTGLNVPPAAAVTARTTVQPATGVAATLRAINTDTSTLGLTVHAGGAIDGGRITPTTVPGQPGELSLAPGDPRFPADTAVAPPTTPPTPPALTAGERMFVSTFGMKRALYKQQAGLRICAAPCDAAAVNALLAANPQRIIWVEGDLALDASVGSTSAPALLVVDGATVTLGANVELVGFVYVTGGSGTLPPATLALPDAPTRIRGAVIAENALRTSYAGSGPLGSELSVTYDAAVLNRLRTQYGTWVRVPGSWRDFPLPN